MCLGELRRIGILDKEVWLDWVKRDEVLDKKNSLRVLDALGNCRRAATRFSMASTFTTILPSRCIKAIHIGNIT